MAELTYTCAARSARGLHTVTRSTGGSSLSGDINFVVRNTLTAAETLYAFKALREVLLRDFHSDSLPSGFPTTGSVTV